MLQVTEGSFLAPAEMVNVLDLLQEKLIWGEISNDVLIAPLALRYLETDHAAAACDILGVCP